MTSILCKRPVAFRVQRANDDGMTLSKTEWRYFTDEAEAARESDALSADCQGLYVRDGTALVAEWQSIGSAPTEGSFLVCNADGAFVISARILWNSLKENTPTHLGLGNVTHWMPLPALPPLSIGKAANDGPDDDKRLYGPHTNLLGGMSL